MGKCISLMQPSGRACRARDSRGLRFTHCRFTQAPIPPTFRDGRTLELMVQHLRCGTLSSHSVEIRAVTRVPGEIHGGLDREDPGPASQPDTRIPPEETKGAALQAEGGIQTAQEYLSSLGRRSSSVEASQSQCERAAPQKAAKAAAEARSGCKSAQGPGSGVEWSGVEEWSGVGQVVQEVL